MSFVDWQEEMQQLLVILRQQEGLALMGHADPDGDCMGSLLGLYHAFEGRRKGWQVVLADPPPFNLRFLPGTEVVVSPELARPPQAVLLVDCAQKARTGSDWLSEQRVPLYILDHHRGQPDPAALTVVDADACAAGELAALLVEENGQPLSWETATCLYTAMVSDTGCFRYPSTTSRALALAAKLLPLGVDLEQICMQLYENRSPVNMQMVSLAFEHLEYAAGGKICAMAIDQAGKRRCQAQRDDCGNLVNFTLQTRGVKMGIFFDELEDRVRISFRCRRGYQVDGLAASFGGGGHTMAAGCRIPGRLAAVRPVVIARAVAELARQEQARWDEE